MVHDQQECQNMHYLATKQQEEHDRRIKFIGWQEYIKMKFVLVDEKQCL